MASEVGWSWYKKVWEAPKEPLGLLVGGLIGEGICCLVWLVQSSALRPNESPGRPQKILLAGSVTFDYGHLVIEVIRGSQVTIAGIHSRTAHAQKALFSA